MLVPGSSHGFSFSLFGLLRLYMSFLPPNAICSLGGKRKVMVLSRTRCRSCWAYSSRPKRISSQESVSPAVTVSSTSPLFFSRHCCSCSSFIGAFPPCPPAYPLLFPELCFRMKSVLVIDFFFRLSLSPFAFVNEADTACQAS